MSTTHPAAPARRIIPAPPTRDELAAQYDRAQAEQARIDAENAAAEAERAITRQQRLEAKARHIVDNARKLTNPERIKIMEGDNPNAKWEDPNEPQRDSARRRWRASWERASKSAVAAWQLNDVQNIEAREMLRAFVDGIVDPSGPLYLNCIRSGPTRTGKTASALAAGHYAVLRDEPITAYFVDHREYLKAMYLAKTPEQIATQDLLLKQMQGSQLLIIDDFGAGLDPKMEVSQHVNANTLALVGQRLETGKATIITTNLTKPLIQFMFEDRIAPRITEDCVGVKLTKPIKDQYDF
jgi:DNA replication protein DnaC